MRIQFRGKTPCFHISLDGDVGLVDVLVFMSNEAILV